jgi:hypothetical protein
MSEHYGLQMANDRAIKLARAKSAIDEEMKNLQEEAFHLGRQSRVKFETIVDLLHANIDNERLSDREFREFVGRLLED